MVEIGPKTLPLIGNIHQIPKDKAYLKSVQRHHTKDVSRTPVLILCVSDLMSGRRNMGPSIPSWWPLTRLLSLRIDAW